MSIRELKILLAILLATCLLRCAGSAGPPAPIAEIPSAVTFPDDVGVNLSGLSGPSPSGQSFLVQKQAGGGEFSDAIVLGPILIAGANDLLKTLLQPLQSLEIPVSPEVRNFEGFINVPGVLPQKLKVDFSPFDFDGDGKLEGTGCTCPLGCSLSSCPSEAPFSQLQPVSYRVWIQNPDGSFVRLMAGLFNVLQVKDDPNTPENEGNPGAGRFRAGIENEPAAPPAGRTEDLFFGVIYDHNVPDNPLFQATEMFVQDKKFDPGDVLVSFDNFHTQAQQQPSSQPGLNGALQDTAKLSFQVSPAPSDDFNDVEYIGRFLEDFDFWSGSFVITGMEAGMPKTLSAEDVCARISTGNATARQNCIDLGIDVGNETFIAPTTAGDVAFPADFPPTPTF